MEDPIGILCTDNHHFYPSDDLPPRNDSPALTSLTVNCQSLLAKRESFMNLIEIYHPDIILALSLGLTLICHHANFFQKAILSIVKTEKMDMVVSSLPAENLLFHAV